MNKVVTGIQILQIMFIGLKLLGYINWPWVWVFAPVWISLIISVFVLTGYGIFCVVKHSVSERKKKK